MKYFNNLYEKNKKLFGENPLDIIKIGEKFLNKKNKIVDLGCGQGRNMLYFLRKAIRNCRNIFGYKKSGKIVDLGCGNGRNLLFLLKNGFDVVGIDNSKEAIKIVRNKIENIITNNNFLLLENGIQEDNFFENSDYLLSYSLHFLGSKQREFLLKLKNKTSLGNFNIIEVFLNEGKLSGNDKNLNIGELKEIYGNWKIYFYNEKYVFTMESNRKDKNKVARIIAQKI